MVIKFRNFVALTIVTMVLTLSQETYGDAEVDNNHMEEQPNQSDEGSASVQPDQPDVKDADVELDDTQDEVPIQENGETKELEEQMDIMSLKAEDYYEYGGAGDFEQPPAQKAKNNLNKDNNSNCWLSLNGDGIFKALNDLDSKYASVKKDYEKAVGEKMDKQMLEALLGTKGAAYRAIRNYGGNAREIPAGINLGGYCMMRMKDSLLFFHRMKLRNSTIFQVDYLHNDLMNMVLIAHLKLNDLHLLGAYERSATHTDPSILFFRPTVGTMELLLKNVTYNIEARMRMMFDRITVEVVISELTTNDILMSFFNTNTTEKPEHTQEIEARNIEDFLERLKTDLDLWMKDYFNDYLMFYILPEQDNSLIQESEKKKTMYLNEYTNFAVNSIRQRVYDLGGNEIRLPKFTLFSVPEMVIKLSGGVLRGLDSMHQRSVATAMRKNKMLQIDLILTFSALKVEYTFEAVLPDGNPPLTGTMVLTADDIAAHLGITLVENQDTVDLNFDFIQHMKPEYLVVEGPVNRLISNYQHLLENEVLALMSNALMHNIKMLNSLPRCKPFLHSYQMDREKETKLRNRVKRQKSKGRRQNVKSPKFITERIKLGRKSTKKVFV